MIYGMRIITLMSILSCLMMGQCWASETPVVLSHLVGQSAVIASGKIVRVKEKAHLQGPDHLKVIEGTAFVQPDAVLKGKPDYSKASGKSKQPRLIAFHYVYGPGIPDGGRAYHMGDDGLWFLVSIPRRAAARYHQRAGYQVILGQQYESRNTLDEVEKEINQQAIDSKATSPMS